MSRLVAPGQFEAERSFYPRVLNAQIHSMVRYFFTLDTDRLVRRYAHLNPRVSRAALTEKLNYEPRFFSWAGCDLMHVTTERGNKSMVVIETNSCPSGQKSMPLYEEHDEQGGYRSLINRTFEPMLQSRRLPPGDLAVLYDKNEMEAQGYAAAMADALGEEVHLTTMHDESPEPSTRFDDGVLEVRTGSGRWTPIRAAFRYVTQRPWNRIPLRTKTAILNPVIACLAGGRNKMVAAKAYDIYNAELAQDGLRIRTPNTIWDVSLHEIPLWVRRLGGHAVIKVPYSNAGQGVFTVTTDAELQAFMTARHRYDRFIVQSLIGNFGWSSGVGEDRLYHVGTIPDRQGRAYAADLRVMVSAGQGGFRPLAIYARRAREPLPDKLSPDEPSWDVLGTNLSLKNADGSWGSDEQRLMLMDRRDFNRLGMGLDELIEAYVQTVLSVIAIDRMALALTTGKGKFRMRLFRSLNDDATLVGEVLE